jgi:hypothetical protein
MAGNKMEFEPEEQQVIELLAKLKNGGGTYPKKLLASRRQVFLSQMASVGVGLGIGEGIKAASKAPKAGTLAHISGISASSVVETVLILAIVAQASVIAYAYRDKLIDLVRTISSSALIVPTEISIPVTVSSPTEVIASDTPSVINTSTPTASASSTVTTTPAIAVTDNNGSETVVPGSTPAPGVTPQPTNGNNGNHYGQTPRPTQEKTSPKATQGTGGGNGGGNGNNNGGKKP